MYVSQFFLVDINTTKVRRDWWGDVHLISVYTCVLAYFVRWSALDSGGFVCR